jgi:hypothetical protein
MVKSTYFTTVFRAANQTKYVGDFSSGKKALVLGAGYVSAPVIEYLTRDPDLGVTVAAAIKVPTTEYIFLLEMKQGYCVYPLSWSVHCNFTGDGKCNERGWACNLPPPPAWADFTLVMEYTPESSVCYSVYSVVPPPERWKI